MNFTFLLDIITTEVNQTGAADREACAIFLNRRYEMIWDSENWTDILAGVKKDTSAFDSVTTRPATLGRVIKLQIVGGDVLEPVDGQFILETNPQWISEKDNMAFAGRPLYYEEFGSSVQLYPPTDKVYSLYFYGKLLFVPLVETTDVPLIRNIDNCLIAYVYADMLERMRQYDKAKLKREEASTLLEQLRATENKRSNISRISKNISVRGDTLQEMLDSVCMRIGNYAPETKLFLADLMRRNYLDVYDSQLWPESTIIAEVDRNTAEVVLPEYFDRVACIRQNVNLGELQVADQTLYFGVDPQVFERQGSPVSYNILTAVGLPILPPNGVEPLSIVSDDDTDTGVIFISGESGGVIVSEEVALTGVTPVLSGYPYSTVITLAKPVTKGTISISAGITAVFLGHLEPGENERKHMRLWLHPAPNTNDGAKALVMGKRKCRPLVADSDTPLLRGIGNLLINQTSADYFRHSGNKEMADMFQQKAQQSLATLTERETKQNAFLQRIVPFVESPTWGADYAMDHSFVAKS